MYCIIHGVEELYTTNTTTTTTTTNTTTRGENGVVADNVYTSAYF